MRHEVCSSENAHPVTCLGWNSPILRCKSLLDVLLYCSTCFISPESSSQTLRTPRLGERCWFLLVIFLKWDSHQPKTHYGPVPLCSVTLRRAITAFNVSRQILGENVIHWAVTTFIFWWALMYCIPTDVFFLSNSVLYLVCCFLCVIILAKHSLWTKRWP